VRAIAHNTIGLSRLAWTAGIVLGASLPHWSRLPVWMPVLLCTCVAWRFAARILRWPLPGAWTMRLTTIFALGAVLLEFRTINGLVPGTALLVVMVSLKFLEIRSQRDHIMLTVIAYFLVFAGLLAGGGPIEGVYLLAFVWITTLGLVQVGRRGPLLANLPTAKLAGKLLLEASPIMVVLFLVFPRLPGPLWSLPGKDTSATTGLSGSMSPGDITSLGLSDEIAFRVEFTGRPPARSALYWRGPVLSNFDGRTWTRPRGMRRRVDDTIEYLGDESRYRVMLEPGSRGWAFALDMPESWSTDDRRVSIRMGDDYELRVGPANLGIGRWSYTVTSYSRYRAVEPLSPQERKSFTRLPPGFNPRTRALVDDFLRDDPDPETLIERGLDVFRADGFSYTLTPPALGQDTADEFIFETREGFCEHYASAFAIMMRMAGLPARVVTGYQGGEFNAFGRYFTVYQFNAHAWTEIWTPEDGWVRVDPIAAVAPGRIALGSTRASESGTATLAQRIGRASLLRQAKLAWDAVDTFWHDWVIDYGPRTQRSLLEHLGFDRPRWREMLLMTVLAGALMMGALTVCFGIRIRKWKTPDPAARSYERFLRKLKRARIEPRRPSETASAYAARATKELPGSAESIGEITTAYLTARYEPDQAGIAVERLRSLVRDFRPTCAHASP
jgi:transglutaminase-like putative cysteine protease